MSHQADELDIKIGLLIQNRISLQVRKINLKILVYWTMYNILLIFRMLLIIK